MCTGDRSSPSFSDSLGYRVDRRGLIYVLTVSDVVSLAVNVVQNRWTLAECLSRPRSEVTRESFAEEGDCRQSAEASAAILAALEQTYEAILRANRGQARYAPTRRSRGPLEATVNEQALSACVEPLNPPGD